MKMAQNDPGLAAIFHFVTDTGAHQGEDGNPIVRFITFLSRSPTLMDVLHPIAQLFLFWARLVMIISEDIAPRLISGKEAVMMQGFGGSVLAHAAARAETSTMREILHTLHSAIVNACVFGMGIYPPLYLYLVVDPESIPDGPEREAILKNIRIWNEFFDWYGTLPGQSVVKISASGTPEEIFNRVLEQIRLILDESPPQQESESVS